MDDEDLHEAEQALVDITTVKKDVREYNPAIEVEHSIVSLLRHRIEKLQEDVLFEDHIKQAILDRLPEAEFSELIRILDTIQGNTNVAIEKILSPFIPKAGERVPLLDENKREKKIADESIFDKATKDDLQAIAELGKAMRILREKQQKKLELIDEEKK